MKRMFTRQIIVLALIMILGVTMLAGCQSKEQKDAEPAIQKVEEQKEEEKLADEARLAEEAKAAEEARLAEEAKLAEKARLAEETKLAEEVKGQDEEPNYIEGRD